MTRQYLALGDSYTMGEGVSASECWPIRLAAALRAARVRVRDPTIVAKTGWTTAELLGVLTTITPPLKGDYDLVTLLIGVNDQYRGLGVEWFRARFLELLSKAVWYARGMASRVVVVSIPDWSVTPFASADPRGADAIAREIDRFNAVAHDDVCAAGAAFVDVTTLSRGAERIPALLADDGLHPSGEMYRRWVRAIRPAALTALRR